MRPSDPGINNEDLWTFFTSTAEIDSYSLFLDVAFPATAPGEIPQLVEIGGSRYSSRSGSRPLSARITMTGGSSLTGEPDPPTRVPEPATLTLLLLGVAVAGVRRRSK